MFEVVVKRAIKYYEKGLGIKEAVKEAIREIENENRG